ncbi:O-antigen ligase family protein [Planctomycetaceae bacterium SH139]
MQRFLEVTVWVGAITVALTPGLVAIDNGGVLPWSFWLATVLIGLPVVCGIAALKLESTPAGIQPHLLTLACVGLAFYAWLQSCLLPRWLVRWFSPGTYVAWTEWLPAAARSGSLADNGDWLPLSVAPDAAGHYIAYFGLLGLAAWCGATLFHSRNRMLGMLSCVAIFGAIHACLGIWQLCTTPGQTLWGASAGHPFGVFVNRNNASLIMNLGVASSLGLLGWRLTIVTGHEFRSSDFRLPALLDLLSDRAALLAIFTSGTCAAGLFACGSRGGLAGLVVGSFLAIGLFSSRQLIGKVFAVMLLISLVAGLLLIRIDVTPRTLERFGATAEGLSENILTDKRLPHWQDASVAFAQYVPAGSGFGSYRYAYLPYEQQGIDGWFLNADNLWLEWLVEGGLIAGFALLCVCGVMIYALLQLRDTPDPMDHGIATAGWCALFVVMVSQIFDFGLLLAGSAITTALLFGAVLGRAASVGTPLFQFGPRDGGRLNLHRPQRSRFAPYFVGGLAVVLLPLTVHAFYQEATQDALLRTAVSIDSLDAEALDQTIDLLSEANTAGERKYRTLLQLSQAHIDKGQLAARQVILSESAALARLDADDSLGSPQQLRRLAAYARRTRDLSPDQSALIESIIARAKIAAAPSLEQSKEQALLALGRTPLAPEPRFLLLQAQLDFPPNEQYRELTRELFLLRRSATNSLTSLARIAATVDDWEQSTAAWRNIMTRRPQLARFYLEQAEASGNPNYSDAVPEDDRAFLEALKYELAKQIPNRELVSRAATALEENMPLSRYAQADQLELLGNAWLAIEENERALENYRKAVEAVPERVSHYFAYIEALKSTEQPGKALLIARQAVDLVGQDNPRLNRLVDQLEKATGTEQQDRATEVDALEELLKN